MKNLIEPSLTSLNQEFNILKSVGSQVEEQSRTSTPRFGPSSKFERTKPVLWRSAFGAYPVEAPPRRVRRENSTTLNKPRSRQSIYWSVKLSSTANPDLWNYTGPIQWRHRRIIFALSSGVQISTVVSYS